MRGSIRKRSEKSWTIILDVGADPETGKRKQKWIAVQGKKRDAEKRLTAEFKRLDVGEFVAPDRITVGEWFQQWLPTVRATRRERTAERYADIVRLHLSPALGSIRLQRLTPLHIQNYYDAATVATGTLHLHHAVLSAALESAVRNRMIVQNPVHLVERKPPARKTEDAVDANVWTPEEARAFLAVAFQTSLQFGALFSLALELGMRRGEIEGLQWENVDLDRGIVRIRRQRSRRGAIVALKSGPEREVNLSPGLAATLAKHRAQQNALKLRSGGHYRDRGFVFAFDFRLGNAQLGDPLRLSNVSSWAFQRMIEKAGVKRISFHGLRHTSATLALAAGVPAKVVSERLGHSSVAFTLDRYSHVLPALAQDAASRIGALLHG